MKQKIDLIPCIDPMYARSMERGFMQLCVMAAIKDGGRTFDKELTEDAAAQVVQMMKQKTDGQEKRKTGANKNDVPFCNLERLTFTLVHQAVALYTKRQKVPK